VSTQVALFDIVQKATIPKRQTVVVRSLYGRIQTMRRTPWATYLWPGLPQLWLEGSWSGLALAVAAAGLLDVLLLSTLIWVEWFAPAVVRIGWFSAGGLWLGAAMVAARGRAKAAEMTGDNAEALFRRAQAEYLQGDYFQAEATLAELLEENPRDAEGRLLLATLLRHSKRFDEAENQLKQLSRFETAVRWNIEITSERARLKRLRKATRSQPIESPRTSTDDLTTAIQLPDTSQAA
jgi:tetratricopeptide (TPR) repeat protein